ncbi:uncharacterized protein Triagg1_8890 [Trichoderma aggressivum f. europaeum]|uniref:HNH nuclease domain-containing protein n=1 Tax=Trichoderma aggressivum f. europaeum TaxID=173218 RepID=A0AAE1IZV1_9HYPO|nr:hypothetical protein Triagg1_8890 [Trichoderma aggressivum f. europaeum]
MALFAILMVAPVDNLQSKVETLEMSCRDNDQTGVKAMLTHWREISLVGIQACMSSQVLFTANDSVSESLVDGSIKPHLFNKGRQKSSFSPKKAIHPTQEVLPSHRSPQDPSTCHLRNHKHKAWLREEQHGLKDMYRDGQVCCLGIMPNPVVAHIFPLVGSKLSSITAMVVIFWVMAGDQNISESPQNLISFNRQLHWWSNNGRMALKPLRVMKGGTVQVQLHWVEPGRSTPDMSIRGVCYDDLITRVDQSHLPNFHLLQLSWELRRVAAVCGAYPGPEDELDDDEEEYSGDDEGHDDDEDCDDNDGVDVDAHLGNWQENQNAQIHQWMGEVEAENGTKAKKASNGTEYNDSGI